MHRKPFVQRIVLSLVVLLGLGLTALGAAQETVTIMAVTSPETEGLKAAAAQFTEETGIEVVFNEQGRLGYFTNVITQMIAGTDAFDLAQINSTFVTELAAGGGLAYWDQYLEDPAMTDMTSYDMDDIPIIYRHDGQITMIPTDAMSQLFYYRSDLIDEAPDTFEGVRELAEQFTREFNPDSPTEYGLVFTSGPGPEAPKIFYTMLWAFGGEVFDEEGNVALNSPETIEAAEYYRSLRPYMPPDLEVYNYPAVYDLLNSGAVAMAPVFWNAAYNAIQAGDSEYADVLEADLIPGVEQEDGSIRRVPQTHSWGLVINPNAPKMDAAWQFLTYATGQEGGRIHGRHGGSPFRTSILQDPEYASGPYYDLMVETLGMARPEPQVVFYSQMHEIMNQMISGILSTDDDIETVVQRAHEELEDLVEANQ